MWFNHVFKVEDDKMISVDNLWKFVMRGALLLSNNTEGIDFFFSSMTRNRASPETLLQPY